MPAEIQAKYREDKKRSKPLPKIPLRGACHQMVNVMLPWVPTVNHYYTVAHGRKILSKAGKAYRQAVGQECVEKDVGHVIGRLRVEVWVYPSSKRRFDLDNLCKGLLDSLQAAGVMEDDSQVDSLTIRRGPPVKEAYLSVNIEGDYPL